MSKDAAAASTQPRPRRTQRERSAAMRERLLEAAIDCLYELGYAGTTTIEVAARAGVSRGAQLHHFPTKEHLVTLAVRHVLARRVDEFRAAFADLPDLPGTDRSGNCHPTSLEKMSIARLLRVAEAPSSRSAADAQPCAGCIAAVETQLATEPREATDASSPGAARGNEPSFAGVPLLAFAALKGLALDRIVWGADDPRLDVVLSDLKDSKTGRHA